MVPEVKYWLWHHLGQYLSLRSINLNIDCNWSHHAAQCYCWMIYINIFFLSPRNIFYFPVFLFGDLGRSFFASGNIFFCIERFPPHRVVLLLSLLLYKFYHNFINHLRQFMAWKHFSQCLSECITCESILGWIIFIVILHTASYNHHYHPNQY